MNHNNNNDSNVIIKKFVRTPNLYIRNSLPPQCPSVSTQVFFLFLLLLFFLFLLFFLLLLFFFLFLFLVSYFFYNTGSCNWTTSFRQVFNFQNDCTQIGSISPLCWQGPQNCCFWEYCYGVQGIIFNILLFVFLYHCCY